LINLDGMLRILSHQYKRLFINQNVMQHEEFALKANGFTQQGAQNIFYFFTHRSLSLVNWELIKKTPLYDGFFQLSAFHLRHELFSGGSSPELRRELLDRGNAVAVLPYDPDTDSVVLIEQFRIGAKDDPRGPWLMEIIAGYQEPGEAEVDVAKREAEEEAGCEITEMQTICRYYSSPGSSSEQIHLFLGHVNVDGVAGVHGLEHEGEDILVHVLPFETAMAMIESGHIDSAMPIIALQWLALNRRSIRAQWRC
jgi:ADP-ribose pyrophosphatase